MKRGLILLTIASYLALTLTLLDFDIPKKAEADSLKPNHLIVHEWGTFTSVAGKDGVAIDWRPLAEASDLPKFVYTEAQNNGFRGTYNDPGKGSLARVRMETPVIYFYTGKEMEVSVKVDFPAGKITEWYPQASVINAEYAPDKKGRTETGINWGLIKLLPNEKPDYLREVSNSHYYPARETDAVPLQVCNADKTKIEKEKFLFYRGIGNFDLPLKVSLAASVTKKSDYVSLSPNGRDQIGDIIIFENFNGRISFKVVNKVGTEKITVERPKETRTLTAVFLELERILVSEGLYEKEARAMIETWKDSWFEEGLRVFYILPTKATNEILPLTIEPKPSEIVRVLVGRAEVITPEMEEEVKKQIALLKSPSEKVREQAQNALRKNGRFYEPVLKSILQNETDVQVREEIQRLISLS